MAYFYYADKKIYYEEIGRGTPLLLLHGNSVSSKMFQGIIDLYKEDYKVILIDFLGHGRSDRLEQFPTDFWYDQAMQVIELLTSCRYGRVNLIGTSGGALAALNVALERPDLVCSVIADSFEGEKSLEAWTTNIAHAREETKKQKFVRQLWEYCHGEDWEKVVDNDTDVIVRHHQMIQHFFHQDLSQLKIPVLLTVSLEDDEFVGVMDIKKTYGNLQTKIPGGKQLVFPTGGHPAMLTNAEKFAGAAKVFFRNAEK
ncbi:alpha/beta fold hydrolase [Emergencia timonensis]|uniref:alpha/beta fold hydrolase n=1 Tax=Emergencia timonensis TaxID=1776384 RepID=UPI003996BFF6